MKFPAAYPSPPPLPVAPFPPPAAPQVNAAVTPADMNMGEFVHIAALLVPLYAPRAAELALYGPEAASLATAPPLADAFELAYFCVRNRWGAGRVGRVGRGGWGGATSWYRVWVGGPRPHGLMHLHVAVPCALMRLGLLCFVCAPRCWQSGRRVGA